MEAETGIEAGWSVPVGAAMNGVAEKAVRSAVVLGLVGAGGIGVELTAAMNLFRYNEALTIILFILVVVIAVEHVARAIRRRVI